MTSEPIIDDRAMSEEVDDEEEALDHDHGQSELDEGVEEEKTLRRRGPEINSLQDLITVLPVLGRQNSQLLRSHLSGVIELVTTDPQRSHVIDWSGEKLLVSVGEAEAADCRISLSQSDLMRVVKGDLNPQIAMLSGRIRASGNPEMAMYLFNLLVRR